MKWKISSYLILIEVFVVMKGGNAPSLDTEISILCDKYSTASHVWGNNIEIDPRNSFIDKLKIFEEINKGAYGVVYKGTFRNQAVAAKVTNKTDSNVDEIRQQINLSGISGISGFYGCGVKNKELYNLQELLWKDLSIKMARDIIYEKNLYERLELYEGFFDTVYQLHHLGLLHRDIKPENMMIKDRNADMIFLVDLGDTSSATIKKRAGTPAFLSPKMSKQNSFNNHKDDAYAATLSIMEIDFGKSIFPRDHENCVNSGYDINCFSALIKIIRNKMESDFSWNKKDCGEKVVEDFYLILLGGMAYEEKDRKSVFEIKNELSRLKRECNIFTNGGKDEEKSVEKDIGDIYQMNYGYKNTPGKQNVVSKLSNNPTYAPVLIEQINNNVYKPNDLIGNFRPLMNNEDEKMKNQIPFHKYLETNTNSDESRKLFDNQQQQPFDYSSNLKNQYKWPDAPPFNPQPYLNSNNNFLEGLPTQNKPIFFVPPPNAPNNYNTQAPIHDLHKIPAQHFAAPDIYSNYLNQFPPKNIDQHSYTREIIREEPTNVENIIRQIHNPNKFNNPSDPYNKPIGFYVDSSGAPSRNHQNNISYKNHHPEGDFIFKGPAYSNGLSNKHKIIFKPENDKTSFSPIIDQNPQNHNIPKPRIFHKMNHQPTDAIPKNRDPLGKRKFINIVSNKNNIQNVRRLI